MILPPGEKGSPGLKGILQVRGGGVLPELIARKEVTVIRGGERKVNADAVVVEAPLEIYLQGRKLVTLLCTPEKRKSLALGFLRSGGLIGSLDDVAGIRLSKGGEAVEVELKEKGAAQFSPERIVTSGGIGGQALHDPRMARRLPPVPPGGSPISAERIGALMSSLQERALIFRATGGMHSAALADRGGLLVFSEDIGRHNAVDKIIGESLLQGIPLPGKMLVCSGRLGSEILLKAARMQLPLLISKAAPTTLSIELAEALNITLIGFVRQGRMNIYSHPGRVQG